jgi:hypothetical protein
MLSPSFLVLTRAFACTAVLALSLRGASAQPLSISGFVLHCDSHNVRSVDIGDTVRVTDGVRTYAAQLNSDGSYTLNVADSKRGYNLYVYSSRTSSPVWQQRITAGRQQTICITRLS